MEVMAEAPETWRLIGAPWEYDNNFKNTLLLYYNTLYTIMKCVKLKCR